MSETTSKYQLDSLFEDFEGIIVRENDTLVGIHDNLKKSEVKGSAVIQDIEKDFDKAPQTLEMSNRAREALHSSLSKIASAMRNKTSLSAAELETLQSEMQKAFDTITTLEGDCQRHLGALGAKTKEYNKYREHSQQKTKGMDESFNHRMNEMMMELRQSEIKVRERKDVCGEERRNEKTSHSPRHYLAYHSTKNPTKG
jgi:DNA repair exonuclease SbcCD ATPase subunit